MCNRVMAAFSRGKSGQQSKGCPVKTGVLTLSKTVRATETRRGWRLMKRPSDWVGFRARQSSPLQLANFTLMDLLPIGIAKVIKTKR